ncbi:MAG: tRNA threonylcarbamoyladenosine dehydratase [Brachymonas sp.]|nr:tRNA threonylcarbamoyladenosine dehydratase [Brachymonas sp.]
MSTLSAPALDPSRRFGGIARLYGAAAAQALAQAHVAVVGIGGVGSWAAEALARSGVGQITLIDLDHVAESNINRQIHASDATLGQAKVQAMQARIASFAPQCRVHTVDDFVEPGNWPALLPAPVDAVIDACDQMAAKTAMAAWARAKQALFITVGAAGGKQSPWLVEVDDLARATHDPLLAQLRQRLRKWHGAPRDGKAFKLACVFSREAVQHPGACAADANADTHANACTAANVAAGDSSLNCHGYGSSVTVTATFGLCAAGWVLQKLAHRAEQARTD